MRICIVDDEEIALSSLRRLLKRRGFTGIQTCQSAVDAVEFIKNNNFNIVVL